MQLLKAVLLLAVVVALGAPRTGAEGLFPRRAYDSSKFQQAYRTFMALHAQRYEYTALVELTAQTGKVSGTVRCTVENATVVAAVVLSVTSNGNSSQSLADYAPPVELMFARIRDNTAQAIAAPGTSAGASAAAVYNATFGFPTVYSDIGGSVPSTVEIRAFRVIARDAKRDALTQQLAAARAKWGGFGWTTYSYRYRETCGATCPDVDPAAMGFTKPVIVNVHDGVVGTVLDEATRQPRTNLARYFTIVQIFAAIELAIDTTVLARFNAVYDSRMGYPTLFAQQDATSPTYDASPTMYISDVRQAEVAADDGDGGPRWIVVVLIIAVLACVCGGIIYGIRRFRKRDPAAAVTDRTMAERQARGEDIRGGGGHPGMEASTQEMQPRPPGGAGPPPSRMGGQVNYDV